MSNVIDQRVAELRFDNAHFEKNVATSMSTLDKLKQKLNLTGASKGLEDLGSAAKRVDMSPLAKGVDIVHTKLSALSSMKDQFFRNLENSIEQTAKKFARMFTIDPVKTGFNEYELKMGSIQTIMASTGESLEKVNGYLNELNEYSDKTIYSFSDMTQNIGKFTNAGVELKDAVAAIQGISNEAALSGANANEASRAMYNFAQALSAGYVKLIDWKSIENANMATVGFKEELINTALEMGTLTKTTEGYETAEGKVITATKNFNDSLQDQWMTSDVLITTLKRYSDETTEIGKKATQAATEVKTFSQMMDSLKESAQSGWAQTWEIIFGNFYEGKKLWTSIYNVASKVLDKMADARNSVLKGVFNSKWDQLIEKVEKAGISTEDFSNTIIGLAREADLPIDEWIEEFGDLATVVKKGKIPAEIFRKAIKKLVGAEEELVGSTEAVTATVENLDEIVKKVMRGEFGNGAERIKKLTEAGYDYATVQNKVNEILGSSVRHVSELTGAQGEQITQLAKLSDEQLANKGYTEEQIEALRELEKVAEGAGGSLDELIASMEKPSGRELLIDSFKNLGDTFKQLFEIIGTAWKNIFGESTTEEQSQSIYDLIERFNELTESMTMSEDEARKFGHIMEGVFSAIEISWSVASASVVGIIKIVAAVLELFGTDLLSVLEWVALKIKDLNNWIDDLAFFGSETKWSDFGKAIYAILDGLRKCLQALFGLEKFSGVAERFKKVIADLFNFDTDINFLSIEAIVGKINDFFTKIETWIKGIDSAENVGVYIVQGLAKGLWSGISFVGDAILKVGKAIFDTICAFFGINSPAKAFIKIGKYCIEGLVLGFKKMNASQIIKVITNVGKLILNTIKSFLGIHSPSTKFQEIAGNCIDGFVLGFKNGIATVGSYIKIFASKVLEFIQKINWGKVVAMGLSIGLIAGMNTLSKTLMTFIAPFKAVGDGIGSLLKSIGDGLEAKFKAQALDKKANAMIKIAIAIGILVAGIVALAKVAEGGHLWEAIGALGAIAGIIALLAGTAVALSFACKKLGGVGGDFGSMSKTIVAMGLVILALALSLKMLSTIDFDSGKNALIYLAGIIVGMSLFMLAIGKLVDGADEANISQAGRLMSKMAFALLLMVGVIKLASMLDGNTVKRGVGVIALVSLLFAGIITVSKVLMLVDAKGIGQMLFRMSLALLIMVGVIKLAAMLSRSDVNKGIGVIAAVELLFAAIIAVSYFAGEHASKAGTMLLKMSVALLIMVGVIKLAAGLSGTEITRGLAVVTGFGIVIAALVRVSEYAGQHASGAGNMLIKASVAMLIMTAILLILQNTPSEGIGRAMAVIAGIGAIFAGLIAATNLAKDADKVKGTLITLTIAVGVLAATVIALSCLDPKKVAVASLALSSVIGVFALLVKMTEHLKSGKKTWKRNLATIITLTGVVLVLGGLIYELSKIENPQSAIAAAGAISVLLAAMATSLNIISKSKEFTPGKLTKIAIALGVLTVVMGLLGVGIWAITKYGSNAQSAIPYAIALSGMLYVMSLVIQNLASLDGRKTKSLTNAVLCMGMLAVVMGILGGVLLLMRKVDPVNGLAHAAALSIMIVVLTGVVMALGKMNTNLATLATAALGLAMLAGVLALLGLVLAMMTALGVKDAMTNALALSTLIIVLTGVCAALAVIGVALPTIATGALGLAMLAGVLALIGLVLAMMTALKVKDAMVNAAALSLLLLAMSGALAILSIAGAAWPAALAGIGCLAAFIVAVGALIAGIGALVTKFPQLETFLDKGIPILVKIGTGIGEFFGSLIGGFIGGIGAALPILGMQLSMFMTNALPFIAGAKLVDESVLKGVGILAAAVLALTVADIINNISLLVGVSLPMLGLELSMFMTNAQGFIDGAKKVTPDMMEGVKLLAETILILTGAGLLEGISRLLGGGSSMERFGSELKYLGEGLTGFITSIGTVTEDQLVSAKNAAAILKTLAQASAEIPNAGGLLGALVGENDMAPWAAQLPIMATGLTSFTKIITDAKLTDEQVEIANKAAKIIKTLAQAASEIPNAGGKLAEWIGDNDLTTFAAQLPIVGTGIAGFASVLANAQLSDDQVDVAKKAASIIKTLAMAATEVPNAGGKLAEWIGDNDLSTWASQLPIVGKGIAGFANELGTFDEAKLATVNTAIKAIKTIASMSTDYDAVYDLGDFTGFGNGMITLAKKVKEFVTQMDGVSSENVASACAKIKEVIKLAKSVADTKIESLKTFGDSLKKIGVDGIKAMSDAFTSEDHKAKIEKGGKAMMDALIKGLESKQDSVNTTVKSIASTAATKVATKENKSAFSQAGKDLAQGLINGLKNKEKKQAVYDAAFALGQLAVQGEKDGQKSNSPSKATEQAGKWFGEGLIIGIEKMGTKVYNTGRNLGNTATNSISKAIAKVSDLVNSDIDSQPTIRPVLDLSDVKSGAGLLSGMFDTTANVGVMSNVRSISSMMNNRQNGNNNDVISAIKDLRDSLGNNSGPTYNINGVSYDGSSGVAEAIETITRHAIIERRI